MPWFFSLFIGLFVLIFAFSLFQKVRAFKRVQEAIQTGDAQKAKRPEAENDFGLIIMCLVLYFFLWFWDLITGKARTGGVAMYAMWWIDGVRVYLAFFVLSLLGLMGLRGYASRMPQSELAKRFLVDEPKLTSLRGSLALFAFFLVFFTIVGMVGLIFLNPEVRALNGMK